MTRRSGSVPGQLSMLELFVAAEVEEQTRHLPSSIEDAVPYFDGLIDRYHRAIMDDNQDLAATVEEEAVQLAVRLNGGSRFGIKGDKDSPCYQLERATTAPVGTVPRWGQTGTFTADAGAVTARIEWSGLYGICIPQFAAHATDYNKPFISNTGYRSFMGYGANSRIGGSTVDQYVKDAIQEHVTSTLKNKLVQIQKQYLDTTEEDD